MKLSNKVMMVIMIDTGNAIISELCDNFQIWVRENKKNNFLSFYSLFVDVTLDKLLLNIIFKRKSQMDILLLKYLETL